MTSPTIEELRAIAARMDVIAAGATSNALDASTTLARAVRDAAPTTDATAVISIRVSPADKACLESIAAARRMSLSKHLIDRGLDCEVHRA